MITSKIVYEVIIKTDIDSDKLLDAIKEFMEPTYSLPNDEHIVCDDFDADGFYASTYSEYTAKMVEIGVTKIIKDFGGEIL